MMLKATVLAAAAAVAFGKTYRPSFDHQTTPYCPKIDPINADTNLSITPFFSPDSSLNTYVKTIQSAVKGDVISLGTPGFDSWSGCTYSSDDDTFGTECTGCTVEAMSEEEFPVFWALLNALNSGVTVNLLTNSYNTPTCQGTKNYISPFDWLSLNGATVRYYSTTTFYHSKFLLINGKAVSISSVNFSHSSFMKNREAGMVIRGDDDLMTWALDAYTVDWNQATNYTVNNTYTPAEMGLIKNGTIVDIVMPPPTEINGSYISPPNPPPIDASTNLTVYTNPDSARSLIFQDLADAKESFDLFMYQITDFGICDALMDRFKAGLNVTVLVSDSIYSFYDEATAQLCYNRLYGAGLIPVFTPSYYEFSHQKYWVVDGKRLGLSTGNWSPSDLASPSASSGCYPQFGQEGWQDVNRDFDIRVENNQEVVNVYLKTLTEDRARGTAFDPNGAGN